MANRQARREQRRAARRESGRQPAPSGGGRRPQPSSPRGGGPPGWLTQPFTIGAVVLAVVLVAIIAIVVLNSSGGGSDDDLVEGLQNANLPLDMASGRTMGSDDAPLKITAYEDYQCPFCLRSTATSEPGIYDYIRSGDVQLEFVPFPILGDESTQAALAAECAADQDKFWQYSHELFLIQAEAGQASNEELNVGRFSNDNLKEVASEVGLDRGVFDTCLESFQHQEEIDQMLAEARALGVQSTPSFAVNGQLVPSPSTPGNAEQWGIFIENLLQQTGNGSATPDVNATGTAPAGDATTEEGGDDTATAEATATAGE